MVAVIWTAFFPKPGELSVASVNSLQFRVYERAHGIHLRANKIRGISAFKKKNAE
jgi:hypothetical protein